MNGTDIRRRKVIQAGAALAASAALPLPAVAAGKAGPGGFSPDGLKRITDSLQHYVSQEEAVGLVTLLSRHGEIAQVNALGWRDREAKAPMQRDSIFRIASMTKPVTGVGVMMLVEEGKLALGDKVEKWLPELADRKVLNAADGPLDETHPAPRPITLSDLMTHRSGLVYDFTSTGPLSEAIEKALPRGESDKLSPDEWMKRVATLPLAFDPGARWNYSISFDVLGVLIERVSGTPFPEFLKSRIFQPLGMKDTGFFMPKDKLGRVASMYGYDAAGKRVAVPLPAPDAAPRFASGGGGLLSTADDYGRFGRMLKDLGKLGDTRILSHDSVELMTANWLTPEQRKIPFMGLDFWGGQGFGLGMSVVDDPVRQSAIAFASKGSFGWPGAFGTWWQADPKEDMVMIYLVQNMRDLRPKPGQVRQASSLTAFEQLTYRAIDD
ncbi:MAG TPA: serine hydrolase domain-containing protein [Alphaproteobacteria bacterium]|nr:serine hydrolase domain-containing protein [Alphaproteobacteria bacterium]